MNIEPRCPVCFLLIAHDAPLGTTGRGLAHMACADTFRKVARDKADREAAAWKELMDNPRRRFDERGTLQIRADRMRMALLGH